jgi:hypothetical protein
LTSPSRSVWLPSVPSSSGRFLNTGRSTTASGPWSSVPSSSGRFLNVRVGAATPAAPRRPATLLSPHHRGDSSTHPGACTCLTRPSVPSSSGRFLNLPTGEVKLGAMVFCPLIIGEIPQRGRRPRAGERQRRGEAGSHGLLSPHHRGDSSTPDADGTTEQQLPFCPLIIGEIPQPARAGGATAIAGVPSVPSSSGRFLNRTPQTTSNGAPFQGWFETRASTGQKFLSPLPQIRFNPIANLMSKVSLDAVETQPGFQGPPRSFHISHSGHKMRYCGSGSGGGRPRVRTRVRHRRHTG